MRLHVNHIHEVAPEVKGDRILLLMLPGAKNTPHQLEQHGFIKALRDRKLPVDVLALDAHADLYLERADIEQTLRHTLDEVRQHGYRRIWLLGISLGGSGAMICATQLNARIEGIFLLAPFLGTRGIIAEIEAAGGLAHWRAGEISNRDHERRLLDQIQHETQEAGRMPPIYLGYGSEDRYRGASIMLAQRLDPSCVVVIPGGHDWDVWVALWHQLLDKQPFEV
jgi:pimeloyl-ACP methyl ester carboxylesterase